MGERFNNSITSQCSLFYTPWKQYNTSGLLMFSAGIEMNHGLKLVNGIDVINGNLRVGLYKKSKQIFKK